VHCCDSHLHCVTKRVSDPQPKYVGLTHPTLRADPPSEQQVHSKVSLRRAVDAVQRCGVCSNRPSGFGKAARRARSLRTWRWRLRKSPCPPSPTTHPPYVTAQALETCASTLTCSRTATVVCLVSDVH
jgi:hypothetical protein